MAEIICKKQCLYTNRKGVYCASIVSPRQGWD